MRGWKGFAHAAFEVVLWAIGGYGAVWVGRAALPCFDIAPAGYALREEGVMRGLLGLTCRLYERHFSLVCDAAALTGGRM